jgi:hypothetical protein
MNIGEKLFLGIVLFFGLLFAAMLLEAHRAWRGANKKPKSPWRKDEEPFPPAESWIDAMHEAHGETEPFPGQKALSKAVAEFKSLEYHKAVAPHIPVFFTECGLEAHIASKPWKYSVKVNVRKEMVRFLMWCAANAPGNTTQQDTVVVCRGCGRAMNKQDFTFAPFAYVQGSEVCVVPVTCPECRGMCL